MRVIVAITGASGAIYGIRLLECLHQYDVKTHLILSDWGTETIRIETGRDLNYIKSLAYEVADYKDLGSTLSSGSFRTAGMIIAPCSMKTLAGIASGYTDNLVVRAADVALKERRCLITLVRETPLSIIHLENMLKVARAGGIIMPPVPAFYNHPRTVDDLVDHTVGRILDLLGIEHQLLRRWQG